MKGVVVGEREGVEVGSPEYEAIMDALMAERLNTVVEDDPFEGVPRVEGRSRRDRSRAAGTSVDGGDDDLPRDYVTTSMDVDLDEGEDLSAAQAKARVEAGGHVTVRSEQVAREVLAAFGLTPEEVDVQVRFGRTGRLF